MNALSTIVLTLFVVTTAAAPSSAGVSMGIDLPEQPTKGNSDD